jgi:hypothetical protein
MLTKFTTIAVPEAIRISGPKAQFLSNLLHTGHAIPVPQGMTTDDFHLTVPSIVEPLERCRWCCGRVWPVILDGSEYYDANCDSNGSDAFVDLTSPHQCVAGGAQ